jgi:RNA polymerase sigma-70 factor (ECF subfamily)
MAEPEDQILVRQALKADTESFNILCQQYYQPLIAIADSILLDVHLAEDAAQETLAKGCRQLPKLKKPEMFGPWIGAICRNIAKDMLLKLLRERKVANVHRTERKDCIKDNDEAILAQALQQLPQNLREVIFLRFYNEKSYEQMANILGVTEQAIDGRLRRAKKKITVYLKKVDYRR